jgi:hypothetical protein
MEGVVRLANNLVVHDPEVNLGKINSTRLRAHGWSEEIVLQQLQLNEQAVVTETAAESTPEDANPFRMTY